MTVILKILDFLEEREDKYAEKCSASFHACLLTLFYGLSVGMFLFGLPLILSLIWVKSFYHVIFLRQTLGSVFILFIPYLTWLLFIREPGEET